MRKKEAISFIKEMAVSCKFLNPSAIFLEQGSKTGDYEIRVKANFDDGSWEGLKILAKKHALGLKMNDHTLSIYKPLDEVDGQLIVV